MYFSVTGLVSTMRSSLASLAVTAALTQKACAEFVIEEDSYFYGQSEPVYPTRKLLLRMGSLVVNLY